MDESPKYYARWNIPDAEDYRNCTIPFFETIEDEANATGYPSVAAWVQARVHVWREHNMSWI